MRDGRAFNVLVLATISASLNAFLIPQVEAFMRRGWRVSLAAGTPPTAGLRATDAPSISCR